MMLFSSFNRQLRVFILIIFIVSAIKIIQCYQASVLEQKISWLNGRLKQKLTLKDHEFKFMDTWAKRKGLYESSIHINFLDKKNTFLTQKLRNGPISDINMFVTSFVLYSQLQAQQLGTIKIDDHDFSFALEALSQFRDKNTEYGLPQYIFWPQQYANGTWYARPVNLQNLADIWPDKLPKPIQKFLDYAGLWMIVYIKQMVQVFSIPADNDDSSVNLALLGLMKQTNSSHFKFWNNFNFNKVGYYKKVLKYAYRPFDGNYSFNSFADQTDTRTYYAIHQFIEKVEQNAKTRNQTPSLILPSTWLMKQDEQISNLVSIPFNVNNVDATVCANVLFGLSYQIIMEELGINQLPQLTQLITDVTDFLVFIVQEKIQSRPDIALVYYPSKYDFYWFLSRTVQLLKRYSSKLNDPLKYAHDKLLPLMKTHGTQQILKNNKTQSLKNGTSYTYWVQFLGNYANKERNDDAIFNTAMALNALYDTWTLRNKSELTFDSDTPKEVKQIIDQGINYLLENIKPKMKEFNSFFSGSMKSLTNSPYSYPANVHDNKGKDVDPQHDSTDKIQYGMRYLMKGGVSKEQYDYFTSLNWFGYPVPDTFGGYNQIPFPFWSSKAITQSMLISVLSKKLKVKQNNK